MKISIIIPALNEEKKIAHLISELRKKEGDPGFIHEIIVSDGGSSDATCSEAERAGAMVVNCSRKGRAIQMNRGAEMASGDVLYFLHADTLPPQNFDGMIHDAVEAGAGSGCFQLEFSSRQPLLRFYGWCTRFRLVYFRFGDQSLFVKADLFWAAGGFDESLAVMEDQEIVRDLKRLSSFTVLDQKVTTSARKYEQNGVLRLQLIFMVILVLHYLGARQETLVHLYRSLIKQDE